MQKTTFEGLQERSDWARAVGRSRATVDRLLARGLPHCRLGRTVYVDTKAAERWIREGHAAAPKYRRADGKGPHSNTGAKA